ncbi:MULTISPECIES: TRAP transporter substrate-binding protein [unclassified Variovorax]|uniref:TRAP transporter substrate-binding protein n=1 Tax=unclassified Variovorax TaxID=663243 RepID=UPI002B23390B|nr:MULTISPECIES: TRAP transporter substrate-binding protein [unclassified Variovorax]MEB0111603.1 TRAP transporter substrate-binding protein [Variovorax sp. RTB1]
MKFGCFASVRRCMLLAYVATLVLGTGFVRAGEPGAERRLRIVGGLAAVNQYTLHEERFWAQDLARLSGGKYSASIVPFNQAGVPGEEMLNLMKLGVIPFGTALLSQVSSEEPELGAADLAGLNPDMATMRRVIGAFRPTLEKTLRDRFNVELLAVYVYPAQVIFCKRPVTQLSDLAGRRTRVSSVSQADFFSALKATPVVIEFASLMSNMNSDNTECAVTGAMSGNTMGLHKITGALYTMPVTWGLAVFGANKDMWNTLPPDLKALLKTELPKLEATVWAESERETGDGVACNSGADTCVRGTRGTMTVARPSVADERRRREIFTSNVLGPWVQRCGAACAQLWEKTIGPAVDIKAPAIQ